ncbi:hypothetical protein E4T56_gene11624 [Termitomyces sp. T112]|nr:hypothetical protein E4T56_gene11624 [Termitomyces sp. T112]
MTSSLQKRKFLPGSDSDSDSEAHSALAARDITADSGSNNDTGGSVLKINSKKARLLDVDPDAQKETTPKFDIDTVARPAPNLPSLSRMSTLLTIIFLLYLKVTDSHNTQHTSKHAMYAHTGTPDLRSTTLLFLGTRIANAMTMTLGFQIDHLQHHLKNEPSLISAPKVLNLASPGASAQDDLQSQLSRFLSTIRKTQALDPDKTTYFIFLGINDLSLMDEDELDSVAELISDAMHDLYVKARARNFVVLDVPPVDFSPQGMCFSSFLSIHEH